METLYALTMWLRRARGRSVAVVPVLLLSMTAAFAVPAARAEPAAQNPAARFASDDATAIALARAIDSRLTVWRTPSGEAVHVQHCRRVPGGCRARIARFVRWMVEVARAHRLDPFLLAAIAMRESALDPVAHGAAGERGIVQLHPRGVGHSVRFVRSDRYRDRCLRETGACQREVIEAGAQHLAEAIVRCGSIEAGLGAYNSGVCDATDYSERVLEERAKLLALAKDGHDNVLVD